MSGAKGAKFRGANGFVDPSSKSPKISVAFEPHVFKQLTWLAEQYNVPVAKIIRNLVEQGMTSPLNNPQAAHRIAAARVAFLKASPPLEVKP